MRWRWVVVALGAGAGIVVLSREVIGMRAQVEADNKQVLADTFRNLVRYPLSKKALDAEKLGVTPENFSVKAVYFSLAAGANSGIFEGQGTPSVRRLLQRAHEAPVTFQFYWMAPERLEAAFALSYEADGDLKVRLLWMGLPERIPVARSAALEGGPKPIEEAVAELLRVGTGGRLAPYPPPE